MELPPVLKPTLTMMTIIRRLILSDARDRSRLSYKSIVTISGSGGKGEGNYRYKDRDKDKDKDKEKSKDKDTDKEKYKDDSLGILHYWSIQICLHGCVFFPDPPIPPPLV